MLDKLDELLFGAALRGDRLATIPQERALQKWGEEDYVDERIYLNFKLLSFVSLNFALQRSSQTDLLRYRR